MQQPPISPAALQKQITEESNDLHKKLRDYATAEAKQVSGLKSFKEAFEKSPYRVTPRDGKPMFPMFEASAKALKEKVGKSNYEAEAMTQLKTLIDPLTLMVSNNGPKRDTELKKLEDMKAKADGGLAGWGAGTQEEKDKAENNLKIFKAAEDKVKDEKKRGEKKVLEDFTPASFFNDFEITEGDNPPITTRFQVDSLGNLKKHIDEIIKQLDEKLGTANQDQDKNELLIDRLNRLKAAAELFRLQTEAALAYSTLPDINEAQALAVIANMRHLRSEEKFKAKARDLGVAGEGIGEGDSGLLKAGAELMSATLTGINDRYANKGLAFSITEGAPKVAFSGRQITENDVMDGAHTLMHYLIKNKEAQGVLQLELMANDIKSLRGTIAAALQNGWSVDVKPRQNVSLQSQEEQDCLHVSVMMRHARSEQQKRCGIDDKDKMSPADVQEMWARAFANFLSEKDIGKDETSPTGLRHAKLFLQMLTANDNQRNLAGLFVGINAYIEEQKKQEPDDAKRKELDASKEVYLKQVAELSGNPHLFTGMSSQLPDEMLMTVYKALTSNIAIGDENKYSPYKSYGFMTKGKSPDEIAVEAFLSDMDPGKAESLAKNFAAERLEIEKTRASDPDNYDNKLKEHEKGLSIFVRSFTQTGMQTQVLKAYMDESHKLLNEYYVPPQANPPVQAPVVPALWTTNPPAANAGFAQPQVITGPDDPLKTTKVGFHVGREITDSTLRVVAEASKLKENKPRYFGKDRYAAHLRVVGENVQAVVQKGVEKCQPQQVEEFKQARRNVFDAEQTVARYRENTQLSENTSQEMIEAMGRNIRPLP